MRLRTAIYLRVSTHDQTIENQRLELSGVAQRLNWDVVNVYIDQGLSGAKGRDLRPGFDELCKGVARREFDQVAAWSVDRLGRSLQGLVEFLGEIQSKGVDLYLHQQGIDTKTPGGKAMFQMLGIFAEFERGMIAERVRAGLTRAKANGTLLGRPRTHPHVEDAIRELLASGVGIHKTAKLARTGVSVVQRIKKYVAMPTSLS